MRTAKRSDTRSSGLALTWTLSAALIALALVPLQAADPAVAKTYPTPLAAADALLTAGAQKDAAALSAVLGPGGDKVLSSGDAVADNKDRATFLKNAQAKTVLLAIDDHTVFMMVGPDDWAFPIPIVKGPQGWAWDLVAGKDEILSRRIGRNELNTIGVCKGYVKAQKEFALGAKCYAMRVISTEGQHDGLYWPAKEGETQSPLGPMAAKAAHDGYSTKPSEPGPRPFHGYLFKIVAAQGKDAPGGARTYINKDGKMTGGFAMVAWPAEYGNSGIMTFIVNQTGVVFEKDLGPKTAELAKAMAEFNPDGTWNVSKE